MTFHSSPEKKQATSKTPPLSGTEVPALSFSLIQNSKTKYKINKHFIQLKLQTP
jgi:hypothetical protein